MNSYHEKWMKELREALRKDLREARGMLGEFSSILRFHRTAKMLGWKFALAFGSSKKLQGNQKWKIRANRRANRRVCWKNMPEARTLLSALRKAGMR